MMFQSKWGHHPCHYDVYKKLKSIKKWYWKNVFAKAEYTRWSNKEPQNRVIREWIRNSKGQKIDCRVIGPRPEPKFCPIDIPLSFLVDFNKARTPKIHPVKVQPLKNSIDDINKLYFQLKGWYLEN
jgi:hypothetical protein